MEKLISWEETFNVYIPEIDAQHRHLLKIINELYDYIKTTDKADKQYIESFFNEIIKFLYYHFSTEEKYMIRYRYPGFDTHKEEHEQFCATVSDYYNKFRKNNIKLDEILNFLVEWFINHSTGVDSLYVPFFQELGIF